VRAEHVASVGQPDLDNIPYVVEAYVVDRRADRGLVPVDG